MKKILTIGMAFMIMAIVPQMVLAQDAPASEKVEKESKKELKKEQKQVKTEKKVVKKEEKSMQKDGEKEVQAAENKQVVKKNAPRPYVSQPIDKPKKEKPKTNHKVKKTEDQKPY